MYRMIRSTAEPSAYIMDKNQMLTNLKLLDKKLRENNMRGEVDLYGGAVMCLGLNARESTHDIDALFAPKTDIRALIQEVADENGLPDDWMNDGVKGFVSDKGKVVPLEFGKFTNLSVFMASPEYLFAMKCLSCRMQTESSTEIDDIKFLINYLDIESVAEAESIILEYYPEKLFKPKTHFMLLEIFDES